MLKVIDKETRVDITYAVFDKFSGGLPAGPILIEASGFELDRILDNFSGIKKTSNTEFQIFIGDDAEFILRNWGTI